MLEGTILNPFFFLQKIRKEKAARLVRFSAAVYINLATIRLQRAYRKAKAIALFKAKIDRLLFIQVCLLA